MAASSKKMAAEILKEKYPQSTVSKPIDTEKLNDNNRPKDNQYLSHHDFVKVLVDNYLAELRAVGEDTAKVKQQKIDELLKEHDEIAQHIKDLQSQQGKASKLVDSDLKESVRKGHAIQAEILALITRINAVGRVQTKLISERVEFIEEFAKIVDAEEKTLSKGKLLSSGFWEKYKHLTKSASQVDLAEQNLKGTTRGRLDETANDLYTKLWRIQTYKNIEVVILYGFAMPAYIVAVETFAIEAAYGDIGIEHPGVDLGISIGLFVSVSMMMIAAFLRKTLRKTWEDEIDPAFEAYKQKLKEFYSEIGVEDNNKIENALAANVQYARSNWSPWAGVPELGKPGFRVDALYEGPYVKSKDREDHGWRKDMWFGFYMLMGVGSVISGVAAASFAHEQVLRIPDRPKPDFPWKPDDPGTQSASSPSADDGLAAPEIAFIAMAAVGLLAAVYLVWSQRQKTTNKNVLMSAPPASGSTASTASSNRNDT